MVSSIMESAFRKHYGNTQLNAVSPPKKGKMKKTRKYHREECSLQEADFFTPSVNVFQMQNQDGFEQQNSDGEWSPA